MQTVTCSIDSYLENENDPHVKVTVTARNLDEEVAIDLARWAVSMELGFDLDAIHQLSAGVAEYDTGWTVTIDFS